MEMGGGREGYVNNSGQDKRELLKYKIYPTESEKEGDHERERERNSRETDRERTMRSQQNNTKEDDITG